MSRTIAIIMFVVIGVPLAFVAGCCVVSVLGDPHNEYVGIPEVVGVLAFILFLPLLIWLIVELRRKR